MSIFILWPLSIILLFIFIVSVLILITRGKHIRIWICSILSAIAAIGGFLFYSYSYLLSGVGLADAFSAALRGIFNTTRMFFISADDGILLTESIWIRILFWLCHISALIVVQAALLALFGRKIIESFRLRFGLHREVFIIKGNDKYSFILGENIATYDNLYNNSDSKRLIIFLLDEVDDLKIIYEKVTHFGGIVKILDKKKDLLYYLNRTYLGKWSILERKYNIILMPNNSSTPDDAFFIANYAKEKNVKKKNLNIYAFTSSEWDREQIESFTQKQGIKYPCTFHIINETDLLIRQMIEKHPPYMCPGINFNEIGIAERNFNVMILGFGTIGQQALLRLIANGQFITTSKSRMHAIVIDRDITHLREHFLHYYPSLELCCEIEFMDYDVREKCFFELLKNCDKLDYVIIALNTNEENKLAALDVRLHYKRKGVKYFPFIAVSEKNEGIHQIKHDDGIFTFGCRDEIYKNSAIINDELNQMAKAVNETYKGKCWYELDWFTQESNRAAADFIPAMLKISNLSTEEAENKDKLTKDAALAENLAINEHLRWMAFHVINGYRPISIDDIYLRFNEYNGERNTREHLDYCRRDIKNKLHVCLAHWDELDAISKAYNNLAHRAGNTDEEKRDFKDNDRSIIENIPIFLKEKKRLE